MHGRADARHSDTLAGHTVTWKGAMGCRRIYIGFVDDPGVAVTPDETGDPGMPNRVTTMPA